MRWRRRSHDQLAAIADQLFIPQPFDLNEFCTAIAEQRGRPLLLLPLDGPPNPDLPCGIWIGLDVADLVFYETTAADVLKVQITLHEIAHMLLGHVAPELETAADVTRQELTAASDHFERILARTTHALDEIDTPALPIAEVLRAEAARRSPPASGARPCGSPHRARRFPAIVRLRSRHLCRCRRCHVAAQASPARLSFG